jgi:antitoxin YefM
MRSVNYSELRQNLKSNLDAVSDNAELLIVHRSNGKSIVVMSLEEYNATIETQYLLQSKNNRERLDKAVENIRAKTKLIKNNLIEE